jgi:hypothetical protein
MKLRNTLILLIVAVGLFAYIWFVDKNRQTTREAMEHGRDVVQLDRDKINAISIQNPEGRIELRKNGANVWQLDEPVKDRADSMAVTQLLTSIEMLKTRRGHRRGREGRGQKPDQRFRRLETRDADQVYGPGKTVELLIGKDSAVEGKVYARLEGSNTVYVISNDLKNQATKKPDDFRDRKLTNLSTTQVKKVTIKRGAEELELDKKNEHWSIVKPLKARGDDSKIGDLVSQTTTAHIETFVSDSPTWQPTVCRSRTGPFRSSRKMSRIRWFCRSAQIPRKEKDKEKTYAKLSTRDFGGIAPEIRRADSRNPNERFA